jgi:hypothetical protein
MGVLEQEWTLDTDDWDDDPEADITVDVGTSPMITVCGTNQFPCLDRDDTDVMDDANVDTLRVAKIIAAAPQMYRGIRRAVAAMRAGDEVESMKVMVELEKLLATLPAEQRSEGDQ